MVDVESELALDRSGLIAMAQLLGSDYTDGVHGVGIVNAMETYALDDSLCYVQMWLPL